MPILCVCKKLDCTSWITWVDQWKLFKTFTSLWPRTDYNENRDFILCVRWKNKSVIRANTRHCLKGEHALLRKQISFVHGIRKKNFLRNYYHYWHINYLRWQMSLMSNQNIILIGSAVHLCQLKPFKQSRCGCNRFNWTTDKIQV